jgi:hypothetical protein
MDENEEGELDHEALRADVRAQIEARHRARFGPPITFNIAQELHTKAQDHQDQLTQEERQLLLSRGDVIGKALAEPSSLTDVERNNVIGRPHPAAVRVYIDRATDGQLSTATELIAKARVDLRGLSKVELDLVANNFNETLSMSMNNWNHAPGAKEARNLLMPAGEQDIIVAAAKQQLMGPETNWEAYVAARQEAEEQRRRAEATRKEEYERQSNAVHDQRKEVRQQNAALGEDVSRNSHVPRYDPVRETFVPVSQRQAQERQPVRGITLLNEGSWRIIQSNANVDEIEGLDRQREEETLRYEEHPQQVHSYNNESLSTSSENRVYSSNPALRHAPVPASYPSSSSGPARRLPAAPYPWVPVPGLESGRVHLQSAYMVYANEQRERFREENPDLTLGRVGKLMGDRWRAMSAEERAPYEARAAQNED